MATPTTAAVATPPTTPPPPRVGGGANGSEWWTGGPNVSTLRRNEPVSGSCLRVVDNAKTRLLLEENCKRGLVPAFRLDRDESDSTITLTTWIRYVRSYMEDHGMDTVFRLYDARTDTETYLLREWGDVQVERVADWVQDLRQGVENNTGGREPPCRFDVANLQMSGVAMMQSVTLQLWQDVEVGFDDEPTGPEVFAAVVDRLQQVMASAVRSLVDRLKTMRVS